MPLTIPAGVSFALAQHTSQIFPRLDPRGNDDGSHSALRQQSKLGRFPMNALFRAGQVPISLPHVEYYYSKSSQGCENPSFYDTFRYLIVKGAFKSEAYQKT